MVPDIVSVSASVQARLVRQGEVSAVELVTAHLERIAEVNPTLNAVVQLDPDAAITAARALDADLARGDDPGPLHGVPFTVKDWIEARDLICAAGEEARRNHVPSADATAVRRLRDAGAILLGKTNVLTDNPVYGPVSNPYDPHRTAGESSSGEAAVIAASGSPFGLGSDSGGSVRLPAHCCGIAGLRPTAGRVPLTGHYPRINPLADPRTVIGPMARFVEDLALVLPVIAGVDGIDAGAVPVPLGDPDHVAVRDLRVAMYTDGGVVSPTPETAAAVRAVADGLADAGLVVIEARPPGLDESIEITRAYWARPESSSWEEWVPDGEFALSPEEIERSIFRWDRFRRTMLRFLRDHDVVVTPAAPGPAVPHGAPQLSVAYLLPYSLANWPGTVVRAGTSPEGLPLGVQVVAAPWRDDVAIAIAALVESITGGWQPPTGDG